MVKDAAGLGAVCVAAALAVSASPVRAEQRQPCDFGRPQSERVVLRPKPGTFFAVDVLNPDLVRRGGRYLLFFSGNSRATNAGDWRTGLAVAPRPEGPFRIDTRLEETFYNGGTAILGGRFFHGANVPGRPEPRLFKSTNGFRWRTVSVMPTPTGFDWRLAQSDLYLRPGRGGLDVYFAGRPGTGGADLGVAHYAAGRWSGIHRILTRLGEEGREVDLGEPAFFRARGRSYLLFVVQSHYGSGREIHLAYLARGAWKRCPGPFIARRGPRYPQNAIDPEPFIEDGRLHVFFGGGQRPSQGGNMAGVIVLRTYALR